MKYCFALVAVLAMCLDLRAQDPFFAQEFTAVLHLNPAFTGSNGRPRATLGYRNQWPQISGGYETIQAAYDQKLPVFNSNVGAQVYREVVGEANSTTNSYLFSYAYRVPTSGDVNMSFGAQVGMIQKSIDWSRLTFATPVAPGNESVSMLDLGAGLMVHTENWHMGGAVAHINEPNESFYGNGESRLPRRYTFHSAYLLDLPGERYALEFYGMTRVQGNSGQIKLGAAFKRDKVYVGLFSDMEASVTGVVGIDFLKIMRINYSYDYYFSDFNSNFGGAHEVFLSMAFNRKDDGGKRLRSLAF